MVPSRKVCDDEECAICCEPLVSNNPERPQPLLEELPCGHLFHTPCLRRWKDLNHSCPLCRVPLTSWEETDEQVVAGRVNVPAPTARPFSWAGLIRNRELRLPRVYFLADGGVGLDCTTSPLFTDADVKPFLKKNGQSVRYVELQGTRVSQRSIKAMYKYCPNLELLNLTHIKHVPVKSMRKLVESCPRLKVLRLGYCHTVNDKMLKVFAGIPFGPGMGLRALEELDISGCKSVTTEGVRALQRCKNLSRLNISFCRDITDSGLQAVIGNCSGLSTLRVRGCPGISMATIRTLAESCPAFKSIDLVNSGAQGGGACAILARSCYSLEDVISSEMVLSGHVAVEAFRTRLATRG